MPPSLSLLFSLLIFSCDAPDPRVAQADAYVSAVTPLLEQNEALERTFLDLAGAMTQKSTTPDDIARTLGADVLPASAALLSQTLTVQPSDAELAGLHAALTQAWQARDAAWRQVVDAWTAQDLAALDRALQERQQARDAEERYLFDANAVLRPYGHQIARIP